MSGFHLISMDEMEILRAAAAGTFVALLVKRPDWKAMASWFIVAQLTAFYWVAPFVMWRGLDMSYYGPVGFGFGALGMILWGVIFSLSQKLSDDPLGTIDSLWRTIRGQKPGE